MNVEELAKILETKEYHFQGYVLGKKSTGKYTISKNGKRLISFDDVTKALFHVVSITGEFFPAPRQYDNSEVKDLQIVTKMGIEAGREKAEKDFAFDGLCETVSSDDFILSAREASVDAIQTMLTNDEALFKDCYLNGYLLGYLQIKAKYELDIDLDLAGI